MVDLVLAGTRLLQTPVNDLYTLLKSNASLKIEEMKAQKNIKKLSKNINDIQNVKTIYKGDSAINLKTFYYPSKIKKDEKSIDISHIKAITDKNSVIQGTAGQGKSIFMRYMTSQEMQQGKRIPIFFELRKLKDSEGIASALIRTIAAWYFECSAELFYLLCESGKIVLFLDGFDEIPQKQILPIISELEELSQKYQDLQIIVSSRPDSGIGQSNYFNVLELEPYDYECQIGLIDKLIDDRDSKDQVIAALSTTNPEIQNLLQTPLMVTLFVMTYRAKQMIPATMSDFYEQIFDVLMTRHDKTKPGYSRELQTNLNDKQMREVFEWICFYSKHKEKISMSHQEFSEIADLATKKTGHEKISTQKLINDLSKSVCLIIKDGHDYSFIHRSIQEFFVASLIKNLNDEQSQTSYNKMISQYHNFSAELNFLTDIDKRRFLSYFFLPSSDLIISVLHDDFETYFKMLRENIYYEVDNQNKHKNICLKITENHIFKNNFVVMQLHSLILIPIIEYIYLQFKSSEIIGGANISCSPSLGESWILLEQNDSKVLNELRLQLKKNFDEFHKEVADAKAYVALKNNNDFLDMF